jgi:hypothetical protein
MRSRRSGPGRPSGDAKASGRRVTRKAPLAHVEGVSGRSEASPTQPFSRILTAWKGNSANFALTVLRSSPKSFDKCSLKL